MPEGDAVWLAARRLHEALAGRALTVSDFRVPRLATADLRGRVVAEAISRGKHLLIRIEGEPDPGDRTGGPSAGAAGGGLTVHTHLKMDGSWRVTRAPDRPPRDHRVRLVLANAEWQAAGHSLGIVDLFRTDAEGKAVGHLGPDLLGPDWDRDEAVRRLVERPDRPIGEALLDQTRLAGIGNIYKAEVLFLRGVHPWTSVGKVPALEELVNLAQRLLDANKAHHGQITTGDRRRGQETWAYGRAGRPCRRCGTTIRRAAQGRQPQDRITYWCPTCQPERR